MVASVGNHVSLFKTLLDCRIYAFIMTKKCSYNSVNISKHCMDVVRKYDYENYLCSLLLSTEIRNAAFAIRALNAELAQIRDDVSNPAIGKIRIQFWRDALDQIYQGKPLHQPIILELFRVIQKHNLSKHWFHCLIDSRERSLYDMQYQVMSDVENYAEKTVSSVFYLLLQAKGINNLSCDHAASHLGKCQGILNLIRSIPYNASKRRVDIPIQELIKHNVSQEEVIRGKQSKNITDLIYDIASVAHQHLQTMRSLRNNIQKDAASIFLAAIICDDYLNRLQNEDFNIFSPKLSLRNYKLPLLLWWRNFWHKY